MAEGAIFTEFTRTKLGVVFTLAGVSIWAGQFRALWDDAIRRVKEMAVVTKLAVAHLIILAWG